MINTTPSPDYAAKIAEARDLAASIRDWPYSSTGETLAAELLTTLADALEATQPRNGFTLQQLYELRHRQADWQQIAAEGRAAFDKTAWDPAADRLEVQQGALWAVCGCGCSAGLMLTCPGPAWAVPILEMVAWATNNAPKLLAMGADRG